MSPTDLAELLKLPAVDRAELAITLWESLIDEERGAELKLGPEERAELDRRWAEHLADPGVCDFLARRAAEAWQPDVSHTVVFRPQAEREVRATRGW